MTTTTKAQPHATTIRHATRRKNGRAQIAQVVTILSGGELIAYFQLYTVADNGRTTLDIEAAYSLEATATARWFKWLDVA